MPMRDQVNLKRWIILVFLLIISVTFLFLQLLSLKAIDSTVSTFFNLNINVNSCDKKVSRVMSVAVTALLASAGSFEVREQLVLIVFLNFTRSCFQDFKR